MNKEIKDKWLKALRSGEYKQGEGVLKEGDKFCCLGVLCDIYHKETSAGEWKLIEGKSQFSMFIADGIKGEGVPPTTVCKWAGLIGENPIIKTNKGPVMSLAEFNDGGGSFKDIADVIEEQL